jgi:hypothetical protein
MLPQIIFRAPSEHRAVLEHARMLLARSEKLLQESGPNTFLGVRRHNSVPADRRRHLEPEVEATANSEVNELIGLTDKLLRCYGRDIEDDNQIFRCVVISDFLIATYAVQPDLSVYRILQRDRGQNLLQLFAAMWHWGLGTPQLQNYCDGPWEKTFRKIGAKMVDLAPSQQLH